MYEPSSGFYAATVQAKVRRLNWHGVLTDSDGTDYSFTADNIAAKTGTITRQATDETEISIGTVYASELKIGLYIDDIGVNRSKIYGGKISLTCTVTGGGDSGDIPLVVFNIT